jgi:p-aminobenzoyl-glutamate transporter AbgT
MLNGFVISKVSPVYTVQRSSTVQLDPFAPAQLPAFFATTNQSAPVLGIGTLASWFLPLSFSLLHPSDWFPQFLV